MREGLSGLKAWDIRDGRVRSDIQKDLVARQHTRPAVVQYHLEGFGRQKTSTAHDQFGTTRPINLHVLRNLAFHHFALAPTNRCHIDSDRTGHRAVVLTVTRELRDFRTGNLILAWHASDIGTGATNPTSLHHGSPSSRLGHVPSDKLAARPAAKDENFKLLRLRHVLL